MFRTAARDAVIEGIRIPAETKVQLLLDSANRDSRRWERPNHFRPGAHAGKRRLALGGGPHVCLVWMLWRMEVELQLTTLCGIIGKMDLAGELTHRPVNGLRTLGALQLRLKTS